MPRHTTEVAEEIFIRMVANTSVPEQGGTGLTGARFVMQLDDDDLRNYAEYALKASKAFDKALKTYKRDE